MATLQQIITISLSREPEESMCTCQSPISLALFLRYCSVALCISAHNLIPMSCRMYILLRHKSDTLVPWLFHCVFRQSDKARRSVGAILERCCAAGASGLLIIMARAVSHQGFP